MHDSLYACMLFSSVFIYIGPHLGFCLFNERLPERCHVPTNCLVISLVPILEGRVCVPGVIGDAKGEERESGLRLGEGMSEEKPC